VQINLKRTFSKKMNKSLFLALAVLLTPSLLFVGGCTDAQKEQAEYKAKERKRASAEKTVRDRAELYWEMIRWKDWDRASRFFEKPEQQLSFVRQISVDALALPTRDNIEVQFVVVDNEALDEAQTRVSWTEVLTGQGSVRPLVVEQRWYKAQGTWWVRSEHPLGREFGKVGEPGKDPEGLDEAPPLDLPSSEVTPDEPQAPASGEGAGSE
jgi:hypothetical protein